MTNSLTIGLFTSNKMHTIHSLLSYYKHAIRLVFVLNLLQFYQKIMRWLSF